jgi:hypothetical protein
MNRNFGKAILVKDAHTASNIYDENASMLILIESFVYVRANI